MESAIQAFKSLNLDFACVTETWFRGGASLKEELEEVEDRDGIKTIHKSRDGRGGGDVYHENLQFQEKESH